jgi:uncharacterized protein (DUF58 family)
MTTADRELQPLLDPILLHRLDRLTIASKARVRGSRQGRRQSKRQGASQEFADYRLYVPGDDIRRLDWNAFARTGKPFLKLYLDEQELLVHLFVDASASMAFTASSGPHPDKFRYARQLAACIGLCALGGGDRVRAACFAKGISETTPFLHGKGSSPRMLHELNAMKARTSGSLTTTFLQPGVLPRQAGTTWLFSDLWYENGLPEALDALIAARQEVVVVHILERTELEPELEGDLRLIDAETGDAKEVAVSPAVRQAYRKTAAAYVESIKRMCFDRGIAYRQATTDVPVENAITGFLKDGLLQA